MSVYVEQIKSVLNDALNELAEAHQSKKVANTPVSNTNYLARWVTNSIKKQRYNSCVAKDLIGWQKLARSSGNSSALYTEFLRFQAFYQRLLPNMDSLEPITDLHINRLLDRLEEQGWSWTNEFEIAGKNQVFTEGKSSVVMCAKECEEWFTAIESSEAERLTKPIRVFVRGDHQQFITTAMNVGLMVHKQSDYKSVIKYHGLYWVFPENCGNTRPEIPNSFTLPTE
jgi:hypothetical protein